MVTGFIDFIVAPSMDVCGELLDKVYIHLGSGGTASASSATASSTHASHSNLVSEDGKIRRPWIPCLEANRAKWQERAAEGIVILFMPLLASHVT